MANLSKQGIEASAEEITWLMNRLRFGDNATDQITQLERYANGHLFPLMEADKHPFLTRLALALGVSEADLQHFHVFAHRLVEMTQLGHQRNCVFYVDAEQSYM